MQVNLILAVVVLTIVNGMPSNSDDVGNGDHFKPCLEWIKCTPEGKDTDDEFKACVKMAPNENMRKIVKIVGSAVDKEWADLPAVHKDYCVMGEEKKKESFAEFMQVLLEEYSSTCSDFMQAVPCKQMTDMNGCLMDIYNKVHAEGKC